MVATAPGEKLLTGRRRMRNWTFRRISSLFFVQKITSVLRKIDKKLLPPQLHFLTPISTKSLIDWGFTPDPIGGAYQRSGRSPAPSCT